MVDAEKRYAITGMVGVQSACVYWYRTTQNHIESMVRCRESNYDLMDWQNNHDEETPLVVRRIHFRGLSFW